MGLKRINKYVVSYCEIPQDLLEDYSWISEASNNSYVEAHVDEEERDPLSEWLLERYPELENEESFFIHINY